MTFHVPLAKKRPATTAGRKFPPSFFVRVFYVKKPLFYIIANKKRMRLLCDPFLDSRSVLVFFL
jgi:hypothetical protein